MARLRLLHQIADGKWCHAEPQRETRIESIFRQYFILFFAAFWCGIVALISSMSGWRELSRIYRATASPDGKRFWFQSASMRRGTNYGNCLILWVNPNGIYLSLFIPFRIGHPPLFIPWPDVSMKEKQAFFFFKQVELRFSKCPSIPFVISRRLMSRISNTLGGINPISKKPEPTKL